MNGYPISVIYHNMSKQWISYALVGFIAVMIIIITSLAWGGKKKAQLSPLEDELFHGTSSSEKVLLPQKIDEKLFTQ
ncbi:hypothetical protein CO050_05840 [Candidatus Roizmanbacteria bacterium CG_4_9_14_0_2_um_filter_38_17]|nr:MAG: hypothetical protein CO050_05840 [Candidatus Roizmanbacteria bacterium CG_4_9_14_0_2_um_filter_38_17]